MPALFWTDSYDARHKLEACCDLQIYKDNVRSEDQLPQFIASQELNLFTVFAP